MLYMHCGFYRRNMELDENMKLVECKKEYKGKVIFQEISIEMNSGIWYLEGKNGAGKSVFCRCLLGLEEFSDGKVIEKGKNILYLPDTPLGEDWLSVIENIELMLSYYNLTLSRERIDEIIKNLNIKEDNKIFSILSTGNAMKVGLFLTFIEKFWDLIIIDEAISHLDNDTRKIVFKELEKRAMEGSIVIIVDHNLEKEYRKQWNRIEF